MATITGSVQWKAFRLLLLLLHLLLLLLFLLLLPLLLLQHTLFLFLLLLLHLHLLTSTALAAARSFCISTIWASLSRLQLWMRSEASMRPSLQDLKASVQFSLSLSACLAVSDSRSGNRKAVSGNRKSESGNRKGGGGAELIRHRKCRVTISK